MSSGATTDRPSRFIRAAKTENRTRLAKSYWASFVVSSENDTLFAGFYEAGEARTLDRDLVVPTTEEIQRAGSCDLYEVKESDLLAEYSGRLIIDWGPGPLTWIQRADNQDKPILELRRAFYDTAFPGYLELMTSLSQLANLRRSWATALAAGRGIYLLTCPKTREQYVGSATGQDGFLQRWREYADTGHGGDVALMSREPRDYQVAILELAGSSASAEDILAMETRWKRKLQSREMGLNRN